MASAPSPGDAEAHNTDHAMTQRTEHATAQHTSHAGSHHTEHASINHPEHRTLHHEHHGGGHGDHAADFRRRFLISILLAVPVVVFSMMFSDLLGYPLPGGSWVSWVSPLLGTVIFFYGGTPFLTGAWSELKQRQPGMMLLISLAITVAFVASWGTTLKIGGFNLDFWWELALLIVIML